MKQKLFTLLTLLLVGISSAWATDPDVTHSIGTGNLVATENTYTYASDISEVKAQNKVIWVEVPAATSMGTINFKGSSSKSDRYLYIFKDNGTVKDATRKVVMGGGYPATGISFTDDDILTSGGKYYLVFSTTDDFKYKNVKYTLTIATVAPTAPTFTPDGGDVDGMSEVTVESTNAQKIFYCWSASATAPDQGDAAYTKVVGASSNVEVPNEDGTKYLHAYGWNNKDVNTYTATVSKSFTITYVTPDAEAPVITPSDGSKFIAASQEITMTCTTPGAVIHYTLDGNAPTGESDIYDPDHKPTISATTAVKAIAIAAGYNNSAVASATITKYVLAELTPISSATTWDFTKLTGELQLTASTIPTNTADYITYSDIAALNDYTIPAQFGDGTKIAFKGQYPWRSKKAQAGYWKFNTTVPGTIIVKFTDTGTSASSTAVKRYLQVNGTKTEYWTSRQNNGSVNPYSAQLNVTTGSIPVSSGDVVITSVGEDGSSWQAIVVTEISFTPLPEPSDPVAEGSTITLATTANMDGWRSYNNSSDKKYTVSANTKVYYASATGDNKVTLEEIAGGVPANTAVILHKTDAAGAAAEIVLTETDESITAPGSNELLVSTAGQNLGKVYRLGYKSSDGVGFYTYTTTSAPAGIIYVSSVSSANFLGLDFGEGDVTAINKVEAAKQNAGEYYNLAGQRVAQPTKGLYIVNGKKVIVK